MKFANKRKMSFFLKRGSSFAELSNVRKRLPSPEEVFREGYVYRKQSILLGVTSSFVRNFVILQHGELKFQTTWEAFKDDTSPVASYKLTNQTNIASFMLVKGGNPSLKRPILSLESPEWSSALHLAFESDQEATSWKFMIDMEIKRQNGQDVYPPPVRSRFFEGLLFKTPPEADRWEERWFELSGEGELSYWQSQGQNKRGIIDLETCKVIPQKTDAPGICTPFFFQIHTFMKEPGTDLYRRRVFNLSAPTQVDYLNWLKALKIWIGVKRPPPIGSDELELGSFRTMDLGGSFKQAKEELVMRQDIPI